MKKYCESCLLSVAKVFGTTWSFLLISIYLFIWNDCAIAANVNTIKFYPLGDNQSTENPITLTFNGKIYTESWWFDEIAKGTFTASEDEKFIIKIVNTYQKGTLQDILNLWSPAERERVQSDMLDPEVFAARQNFFKNAQFSAFMVKMLYGSYTIFLIQHTGPKIGSTIVEYPIIKVDNNYYLTNKLETDPIFVYIVDKYISAIQFKQRIQ